MIDRADVKLILIVIGIIALVIFANYSQVKDCHEKGGQIVGTGEYSYTYINSGNALIPVPVEVQACDR